MTIASYEKDPGAVLDYSIDWSAWVPTGDSISAATWSTSDAALVVESSPAPSLASGVATAWLSGGVRGVRYTATCQVTTTAGRIDERSIEIKCRDR